MVVFEGIGEVGIGAGLDGFHGLGHIGDTREHENGKGRAGSLEFLQDFHPAHVGKLEVQDDSLDRIHGPFQAQLAVFRRDDLIAADLAQKRLEQSALDRVVVNDQDFFHFSPKIILTTKAPRAPRTAKSLILYNKKSYVASIIYFL